MFFEREVDGAGHLNVVIGSANVVDSQASSSSSRSAKWDGDGDEKGRRARCASPKRESLTTLGEFQHALFIYYRPGLPSLSPRPPSSCILVPAPSSSTPSTVSTASPDQHLHTAGSLLYRTCFITHVRTLYRVEPTRCYNSSRIL
jgi:hypothetical protein